MRCFGRIDEANAGVCLRTRNILIEGKISSRQVRATPRTQDKN
jgi:hypothetical protein